MYEGWHKNICFWHIEAETKWPQLWLGTKQVWSHYLNKWWPRFSTQIFIIGHRWVNITCGCFQGMKQWWELKSKHFDVVLFFKVSLSCQSWCSINIRPGSVFCLARGKLRLCLANHRAGYFSNLPCDWLSIVWAYSEQETENSPAEMSSSYCAAINIFELDWNWSFDPQYVTKSCKISGVILWDVCSLKV